MLDFYGFVLVSPDTGELQRSDNWKSRFANLDRHFHNFLRITRILKSLGELGWENIKLGFVLRILREIQLGSYSSAMAIERSAESFWFWTLRDPIDRSILERMQAETSKKCPITEEQIKQILEERRKQREMAGESEENQDADDAAAQAESEGNRKRKAEEGDETTKDATDGSGEEKKGKINDQQQEKNENSENQGETEESNGVNSV